MANSCRAPLIHRPSSSPPLSPPPRRVACRADAAARAPSPLDRLLSLFSPLSPSSQPRQPAALRPTPAAAAAARRIVEIAEATERGTKVTPEARAELLDLAATLRDEEAAKTTGSRAAAKAALTGTWRQLFSTEKETLFIFTSIAPLFGVKGEEAYQVIDADAGRLQNVITFSNGARFVVESTLSVEGDEEEEEEEAVAGSRQKKSSSKSSSSSPPSPLPLRCSFQFTGAALKLPSGKVFNLPPAGKGWFDTTYVDGAARVAFDVRKDTLVVERDGPPRWF